MVVVVFETVDEVPVEVMVDVVEDEVVVPPPTSVSQLKIRGYLMSTDLNLSQHL